MAPTRGAYLEQSSLLTPPYSPDESALTDHELQSSCFEDSSSSDRPRFPKTIRHKLEDLDFEQGDVHRLNQQLDSDLSRRIKPKTLQKLLESLSQSLDYSLPPTEKELLRITNPIPSTTSKDVFISGADHSTFTDLRFFKELDLQLPDTQRNSPEPLQSVNGKGSIPNLQQSTEETYLNPPSTAQDLENISKATGLVTKSKNINVPPRYSLNSQDLENVNTNVLDTQQLNIPSLHQQSVGSVALKLPLNKITCRERKRIVISAMRPPGLTKSMQQWVIKTHALLDPFREDDDCWFHPSPPPGLLGINGMLRPVGKLQKTFMWQDRNGKHSLVLNYGIVSKLVNYKMTNQQKDGFVHNQWHLSHLCGNWTCVNPLHHTVEPGSTNISRNNCFSHRSGCLHRPACLKNQKVDLDPHGKPRNHEEIATGAISLVPQVFNDWSSQSFDDGEASVIIDGESSQESTFSHEIIEAIAVQA